MRPNAELSRQSPSHKSHGNTHKNTNVCECDLYVALALPPLLLLLLTCRRVSPYKLSIPFNFPCGAKLLLHAWAFGIYLNY
jgi:hypothetical protein